uniref:Uncharacterized protein n=1 Tax=Acrobeloides nanus TaxID=290746 RepID=A0A914DQB2_9BILA
MDSPRNIMWDPRVYRGSVAARQREELKAVRREILAREAEERYRMEVIRNRLNLALGDSNYTFPASRLFMPAQPRRIARLAGRMGRRPAITEWPAEAIMERERRLRNEPLSPITKKTTTTKTTTRTTAITVEAPEYRAINGLPEMSVHIDHKKSGKTKINFRNVRFVPIHEADEHKPHKVVPTLQPEESEFVARRIGRKHFSEAFTPPTTAYGPIVCNEVAVQTEEIFEEAFGPLIAEMAQSAIEDALRNLREEEEFLRLGAQNEKLFDLVLAEKQKNTVLSMNILDHLRIESQLAHDKQVAVWRLEAIESHSIAVQMLEEIIDSSMRNLTNRSIIDCSDKRSVAADTRQLEKDRLKMNLAIAEVEKDFFPYIYARAEKIFIHRLTDSYLRDALFCKDRRFREEARQRLNTQIAEYNQLMRRSKSSPREKA